MKWKEFKKRMEEQGIKDDTEITYIDTDMFKPTAEIRPDGFSAYIE